MSTPLSAGLESDVTRLTEDWVTDITESRLARLALAEVHFDLSSPNEGLEDDDPPLSPLRDYPDSENGVCSTPALSLRSASVASFRAPVLIHRSNESAIPPSLTSDFDAWGTEGTPTEASIDTGLADHLSLGIPLLTDNEGVLEQPPEPITEVPVYECPFWFLSCGFITFNQEEWTVHAASHFRGEVPPTSVECPLCDWKYHGNDGRVAWNTRMQHVRLEHAILGQTLRTSRPDFGLFHHLWSKRLIDDQDYKELLGRNHNLSRPPGNFVDTTGRERRRERDGRRHRRQHVTTLRSHSPQSHESPINTSVTLGEGPQPSTVSPETVQLQRDLETITAGSYQSAPEPPPLIASHDDRGDSGYGTYSNAENSASRHHEDDSITIRTMLSDSSLIFQPPEERDNLIFAFVKDLYGDIKIHDLPEQARVRSVARLADLLKMFSLRLETVAQSSEERNAKDFIRQQRDRITLQFQAFQDSRGTRNETTMNALPQGSMSVEDKIANWDTNAMDDPSAEQSSPAPLYQHIRPFLLDSSAYKLLVERARCAANLTETKHDAMGDIARAMHEIFASLQKKHAMITKIYEIHFTLPWDLPEFLRSQDYDTCLDTVMEKAIAITGGSTDAQAMTCAQYMAQVWPSTGHEVLQKVQRAISAELRTPSDDVPFLTESSLASSLPDGVELDIKFGQGQTSIIAQGHQAAIIELTEQIAWLGSALRPALTSHGVTIFKPIIDATFVYEDRPSADVHINFVDISATARIASMSAESPASCWHAMFRNPTVVHGFPILARDKGECGLHIPSNMMCALAETTHLTSYSSTLILKSPVTMLVPTARTERSITWHFLHNGDGRRLAYNKLQDRCSKWLDKDLIDPEDLLNPNMGHFVGWCPRISRHLGTDASTYENIEYAGAKKCTAGYAIEQKLTISASRYVGCGIAVVRGNRDRAEFVKYAGYSTQIEFARHIPVLLYDTATQQAWLADGVSALLHIARTQVVRKPYGGDNSLFGNPTFNTTAFAHPKPSDGSDAAMHALKDNANMKHKILREFQSYADEKIDWESIRNTEQDLSGSSQDHKKDASGNEEVYKTISFKELVCQTWSTLEQIYDRQMEDAVDHAVKPLQNPFQDRLEGYEYMGIVSAKHRLTRRGITLHTNGPIWLPFIKRIHAITLFGKHFGEIYKPTELSRKAMCEQWTSVPRGQEYMIIPVSLLKEIRENSVEEGEVGDSINELAEGVFWCPSSDAFKECEPRCKHIILGRVQQLSSKGKSAVKSASSDQLFQNDGAVIFGESSILNAPKMQKLSQKALHPDSAFDDSGLGTSIQSSTTQDPLANLEVSQSATQDTQTSLQNSSEVSDIPQATRSTSSDPLRRDSSNATSSASDSGSRSSPRAPSPPPQLTAQSALRDTSYTPAQTPSNLVTAGSTPAIPKSSNTKARIKSAWRKLEARLQSVIAKSP